MLRRIAWKTRAELRELYGQPTRINNPTMFWSMLAPALTSPARSRTVDSGVQQILEPTTIEPDPALLSRAAPPAAPQGRTQRGGGQ